MVTFLQEKAEIFAAECGGIAYINYKYDVAVVIDKHNEVYEISDEGVMHLENGQWR